MQTLSYTRQGKGSTVVLIHGFCETKAIWDDFLPVLAQNHQVIALDLGGFGESKDALPSPTSMETLAEQIHDLMTVLHIEQSTFIAHSLGGYVALAFAEHYPHKIAGLCLFHSTALSDNEEKKKTRDNVVNFVQKNGVAAFVENFVEPLFFVGRKEALQDKIKFVKEIALQTPQNTLIEITKAMRNRKDSTHILQNAAFPISFIIGRQDNSVLFDTYKEQITLPKNCTIHILDQTAHMGMFERPTETLKMVVDFCVTTNHITTNN